MNSHSLLVVLVREMGHIEPTFLGKFCRQPPLLTAPPRQRSSKSAVLEAPVNRSILSSTSVLALRDGTRLTQRRSSRHRKVLPISSSGRAVKSRERPPDK